MYEKITSADLEGKGVVGLPDTPELTTSEMQQKFDEIATDVIVPKFNDLIDELEVRDATPIDYDDLINKPIIPEGVVVEDNLESEETTHSLSANQGRILKEMIEGVEVDAYTKAETNTLLAGKMPTGCVDNVTSTSTTVPLSANMGRALKTQIDTKVNTSSIVNNVTSTATNVPLSANMGKWLNDNKLNKTDLVDSLTSTSTAKALTAKQGKALNDKINALGGLVERTSWSGSVLIGTASLVDTGITFKSGDIPIVQIEGSLSGYSVQAYRSDGKWKLGGCVTYKDTTGQATTASVSARLHILNTQ